MRSIWLGAALLGAIASQAKAATNPCATCHPKQVSEYQKTGMANSLTHVARQPSGSFRHSLSDSEFRITTTPKGMTQTLEREGVTGEFPVDYVIGSGNHAFGYLVNVKGYLFQSPISYYSKRRIWDMAPGFESDRNPDVTRPVTAECLWCHSGKPLPIAKMLNKFEQTAVAEEAISCDRCHGDTQAHLRKPSAANILNPKRLAPRERDSVCEQCHLSGEARIPNPGNQIGDFYPGRTLESVFSTYVFDKPAKSGLKVISHVEQLAQSVCRVKSGDKLWCGTCHNPHEKPVDVATYYRNKCLECHQVILSTHAAPADNCVACHMPTRPAWDGGHTAFTDHEIQKRPVETGSADPQGRALVAWHPPPPKFAVRNLGVANVAVGERDRTASYLDEGQRLLTEARTAGIADPAVMTSLGLLALRQRKPQDAIRLFELAVSGDPGYAPYLVNLATALKEANRVQEAVAELNKAIELDPSLEPAYRRLAEIMRQTNRPDALRQVFERYLKFMPENVNARIALQSQ